MKKELNVHYKRWNSIGKSGGLHPGQFAGYIWRLFDRLLLMAVVWWRDKNLQWRILNKIQRIE